MKKIPSPLAVLGFSLSLVWLASTAAADWPQWRGPQRDGRAASADQQSLPATGQSWPAELQRRWFVAAGLGHASPIVQGDRVYLFSREGQEEVVRALDLASGKVLWRQAYAAPYEMHPAARSHGPGPKATPVVAAGKLCTFGISGILSCFAAEDGRLLWRKEFGGTYKTTSPLYGTAASPVITDGLLISHVGGHHDGALTAFDVASGEVRWRLAGDGPGYASPVVATLGGQKQVITQTDRRIVGVGLADGQLLWSLPFTTPYDQNSVTPLVAGDRVILSGLEQGVFAVEPRLQESQDGRASWKVTEVWKQPAGFYMSSPVLAAGRLIGLSHARQGQFRALDPATGQEIWASQGKEGDYAALLAAGDVVLALTPEADLLVLPAAAKTFDPLARYEVADSPTWAHPVLTDEGLLIKDLEHLALWEVPAAKAAATPAAGR